MAGSASTSKGQMLAERRHSSYHRENNNSSDDDDVAQIVSVSSQSSSRKAVEQAEIKRKRARTASSSGSEQNEQDTRKKARPANPSHSSTSRRASLPAAKPAQMGVRKSTSDKASREAVAKGKSRLRPLEVDEEGEEDSESEKEDDGRSVRQIASSSRMRAPSTVPPAKPSHQRPSSRLPADRDASIASAKEPLEDSSRHDGRAIRHRSEATASQKHIDGLTRHDSLDSQSSIKNKGKGRERQRERAAAAASDDDYVDKADKARLKRPSPSAGRQNHPSLVAASSGSSLGARASGPGTPTQKEKRQKKELKDLEDSFNEAAAASARWEQRAKKAEQELVVLTRSQNDSLARAQQVDEISDEALRAAQADVKAKDWELRLRQAELDRQVLKHREDLRRIADKHSMKMQAQTQASVSNEKIIYKLQAEHGEEIARLQEQYQQDLERMQADMTHRSATSRLEAKDREIEGLHHLRKTEVEDLRVKYDSLKEAYRRDSAIWSGHGSGVSSSEQHNIYDGRGVADLPTDVPDLQRKVLKLLHQKDGDDALTLSMKTRYKQSIDKLKAKLASAEKQSDERYNTIETARKHLEEEKERYFSKWKIQEQKNKQFEAELKVSRTVRPEWEKLRKECPELREQVAELRTEVESLTTENSKMLGERVFYVEALNKAHKELDELRSLGHGSAGAAQRHQGIREDIGGQLHREKARASRTKQKTGNGVGKARAVARHGTTHLRFSDAEEDELADAGDDIDNTFVGGDNGDTELDLNEDTAGERSPSPVRPMPRSNPFVVQLREETGSEHQSQLASFERFESTKPAVLFPPLSRLQKADTKVPRHKGRVYVRSECHTPYVPDEYVEDSDDDFYDWEIEAYARSQARNPDKKAAVINVCWVRRILDNRGKPPRSQMLTFCTHFVKDYGSLIATRRAGEALLNQILQFVKLGELTPEEGSAVMRAFHQSVRA